MKKKTQSPPRPKTPATAVAEESPAPPTGVAFPIVGIGASAGGIEALDHFMANLPLGSGLAVVFVQHLDPTRKGVMAELLQRSIQLKVMQVRDRTRVRPDRVYVIPPNKDMSILHGVWHLFKPGAKRGQRLPIDFFLRSLVQDQQQRSIGVILSGMGTDGTLGLRDIKEKGGYRMRTEIRETVIFSTHSLILDPPFTKLDLLSCRNLLIYLVPVLQNKILPIFHYSLNPGGTLLLGNAETIGQTTKLEKAKVDLKEQRKRARKGDVNPPRSANT